MKIRKVSFLGSSIFIAIILVSVINSIYMNSGLNYISNNARIINYAGIVRGVSQRLVKLELNGIESDRLIRRDSAIIDGLLNGSEELSLVPPNDDTYQEKVIIVKNYFENEILVEIENVRNGSKNDLLNKSEIFFQLCDEMVTEAEIISVESIENFKFINTLILFINLVVVLIAFRLFIDSKDKEIEDLEFVDKITGGFNANKFKAVAMERLSAEKSYTIGYFDIKNIRLLNDNVGFQNGNRLLKLIIETFLNELSEDDIIGRNVADEFYILVKSDEHEEVIKKLENTFDKISVKFNESLGINYPIDFYCGLYEIEDDEININVVSDRARHAHLEAKMKENEKIVYYDDQIHLKILNEINVQNIMYDALNNGEFKAYLQPKFNTKTKKLCGAEALTRWITKDGKIIYPTQFIHIFEKNGFIVQVDFYILNETCKIIRNWIDCGITPVPISVNFSRKHLNNDNFIKNLEDIVDKHNIPHNLIEVEMTESIAVENMEVMMEKAKKLSEKGFSLSMDDFGSGYSSLGVLQKLDFDIIKLDRSFITSYSDDKKSTVVLSNILHMAKELDITSVAEGVECEEQYQVMLHLGCNIIQGYYFSKPVPSDEFIRFFT